ncbi:MAG: CsbD family protein [Gammaproteobacteria bacterium]|jgi:uncharacterized protein YjbJ (UPF0337 family)|nr:CsbD family protein [Gammaproteobacteria bacterium]
MNNDRMEGKWHQVKGKVKAEWNELTDDDLDATEGRIEELAGKIQERYGIAKDKARERLNEINRSQ